MHAKLTSKLPKKERRRKGTYSSPVRPLSRLRYHRSPLCILPTRRKMAKDGKSRQDQMRARIAAVAARLMAEDGIDNFALAKRKASRQLGAASTQSLPGNDEIEMELRAYQSLYQGEEQRERIRHLRQRALEAMRLLEQFHPYLSGSVLKGTAGRYSEIDLQLFTDDSKAVELFLLNRGIRYDTSDLRHFAGGRARAVSVLKYDSQGISINLAVYALKDERSTLRTSLSGRPMERAGLQAVGQLVAQGEGISDPRP